MPEGCVDIGTAEGECCYRYEPDRIIQRGINVYDGKESIDEPQRHDSPG